MEVELPEEARALLDAVVAIGADLDLHGVLRRIVESACALSHAEHGVLAIADEAGGFTDLIGPDVSNARLAELGMPVGHGLLGLVPSTSTAVRVDHVAAHAAFTGLPDGHPQIDRFLGVPVMVGDRAFGHLYLGNGPGGPTFSATDQALVEALGRTAGVMISNARAFEQSERHRAWMEGVARVSAALAPSLRDDRSLDAMVGQVREMAGARAVALLNTGSGRLEIAACSTGGVEDVELALKSSSTDISGAAAAGELLDIRGASRLATVVVPIRTELADPAALLIVEFGVWDTLDGVERGLLDALAEHVGLALDRAQALRERYQLLLARDRNRIARDLHDLVIQRLFAAGLQLRAAAGPDAGDELRSRIAHVVAEIDGSIADLRTTITQLNRYEGQPLHQLVRALVGEYEMVLGFLPTLRVSGPVNRSLTSRATDALLLTLREMLSNMTRHAHATSAAVELVASSDWVTLRVSDDGVGFDPDLVGRRGGLDNVRDRAEELGGHLTVGSADGRGCRLEWTVPAIG